MWPIIFWACVVLASTLYYVTQSGTVCGCPAGKGDPLNNLLLGQIGHTLESIISPDEERLMLCETNTFRTTCQEDGTYYPPLPSSACVDNLSPLVWTTDDPSCPHTMYIVGYLVDNLKIELYRSCYDAATMTAYFSINTYYPINSRADRPLTGFYRDGLISSEDAASFERANIYDQFEALLGPGQQYIPSPQSSSFDRGHLTPSADFVSARDMQQTNRYLNAFPQHFRINRGTWRTVENWVRRLDDTVRVLTGVLGILELNNRYQQPTPIYLAQGRNPVPRWVYKIVHSEKQEMTYVILTSNNGWETERPDPSSVCQEVPCPPTLNLKGFGFTFCCEPQDFISRIFR